MHVQKMYKILYISVFIKSVTIIFDIFSIHTARPVERFYRVVGIHVQHVSLKYQVKSFTSFQSLRFESTKSWQNFECSELP